MAYSYKDNCFDLCGKIMQDDVPNWYGTVYGYSSTFGYCWEMYESSEVDPGYSASTTNLENFDIFFILIKKIFLN